MVNVIYKRRSIRKFDLSKNVTYENLLELCRAASAAPSAKRQIDKEYIIIDDKKIIEEIAALPHGTLNPIDCNSFMRYFLFFFILVIISGYSFSR